VKTHDNIDLHGLELGDEVIGTEGAIRYEDVPWSQHEQESLC
jgi:hypothetical protein